ncbi:YqcC family protein [Acerihabitans sp. TG2]|uniref:YqcC family protein n=1 Tax=Acerihabitans sp. TG2 TaxID=3096008 RepID=UPI002B226F51|nr:YqcC family protein [Acerihabitans sp. TG2]MEA9392490.1 YqcC family protein [Acerihabitans sp. TG2]
MDFHQQIRQLLFEVEQAMQALSMWQAQPPAREAFDSVEPFSIDTMCPEQWLQWILLPRMHALLDQRAPLPQRFVIAPYFEQAMPQATRLLVLLRQLDEALNIDFPPGSPGAGA